MTTTFSRRPTTQTRIIVAMVVAMMICFTTSVAQCQVRLADICRVKGQEPITLHGYGLVVGLNGTGDGDKPATRMLAQSMNRMGANVGRDENGGFDLSELKSAKNVALVFVTAEVPTTGARQGGSINCTVNAVSAKSIEGGTLLSTPLLGPHPADRAVYATAQGAITNESTTSTTVGRIHGGGRLIQDFKYKFHEDGVMTLVVDPHHASFQMAQIVADAINRFFLRVESSDDDTFEINSNAGGPMAKAIDARTIKVTIPEIDLASPVDFMATIEGIPLETRDVGGSRVVIREKSQVIVVGRDVMIRPVAVAHKNLTIEAGGRTSADFVQVDPKRNSTDPSFALSSLVNALNALKVEPADKIEIIKAIHAQGALVGQLIIE